jgi:hypothetical protein
MRKSDGWIDHMLDRSDGLVLVRDSKHRSDGLGTVRYSKYELQRDNMYVG